MQNQHDSWHLHRCARKGKMYQKLQLAYVDIGF